MGLRDGFWVGFFGDFDVVEAAWAFNVGAVSSDENHDVAPIGDDGVDFFGKKFFGGLERNAVRIFVAKRNVVFAGFEVGAEGTGIGDELDGLFVVLDRAEIAGKAGER